MSKHLQQITLAKSVSCSGIGVHSGKKASLTLHPAPVNHGIRFVRTDTPDRMSVAALFNRVVDTSLATVIGEGGIIISTIEHLMASFTGMGIDNALVEVDAYEMPIMDGSAAQFTDLILSAGTREQDSPKHFFVVTEPIELEHGGKSVAAYPASSFKLTCTIEYDHPLINTQTYSIELSDRVFREEICRARTFGFLHEIEYLKRYGLARGGSLDNAIVIDKESVMNEGGLRYADEFVRHKLLDCIGDFSLLGMPILGHIVAHKSGHAFNHAFLQEVFSRKDAWETRPVRKSN